jgi:hypothetical protein
MQVAASIRSQLAFTCPNSRKGVCGNYVRSGQLPMRATRKRVELVVDGTKGSNPAAEQHRVGKYIGLDAQC